MRNYQMQTRMVQTSGGSSFTLSLPKEWVQSVGIQKNDPVGVVTREDGDLVISTNISGDVPQTTKVLNIKSDDEPVFVLRNLIGIYIAGYKNIEVRSQNQIPVPIRKIVKDFSNQVIGLELVETTDNNIILCDLFNPFEMSFHSTIKRMQLITREMHLKVGEVIKTGNVTYATEVIQTDREVDRLFWLILRQTTISMQIFRSNCRKTLSMSEVMHYYHLGRIIERVADYAVVIAQILLCIDLKIFSGEMKQFLDIAIQKAVNAFDQSLNAVFSSDMKGANRIIEMGHLDGNIFETIDSEIMLLPTEVAVNIRRISESFERICEYSAEIAEEMINYGVITGDEMCSVPLKNR